MELMSATRICFGGSGDHCDVVCLACSGKNREDLMDRAEVVEALARLLSDMVLDWESADQESTQLSHAYRIHGIERACDVLNIRPAVEKRARELKNETDQP